MVDFIFPDHSAQEELITTSGKAELLYKGGKKIMRYDKSTWGCEINADTYALIKDLMIGRILNVGLGMGTSADIILNNSNCTELIAYEYMQDIVNLYTQTHNPVDDRLELVVADAFNDKPIGIFDVIFYEIETDNQGLAENAMEYIAWAKNNLTANGTIILWYNDINKNILGDTTGFQVSYISRETGMKPKITFIKLTKI